MDTLDLPLDIIEFVVLLMDIVVEDVPKSHADLRQLISITPNTYINQRSIILLLPFGPQDRIITSFSRDPHWGSIRFDKIVFPFGYSVSPHGCFLGTYNTSCPP
jgi:hypothetical protein